MNSRERLYRAVRREKPDRAPKVLHGDLVGYVPAVKELFEEKLKGQDPAEVFGFDVRGDDLNPTRRETDWTPYLGNDLPSGTTIDEWGVGWMPGSSYHFAKMRHPMANFETAAEVEAYPFPDRLEDSRYEGLDARIEARHQAGLAVGIFAGSIFEQTWFLRGMDLVLMEMMTGDAVTEAIMDRVTHILCEVAARVSRLGVDVLVLGDDVGTQRGMMMRPELWRRVLKPRLARVIRSAKEAAPDVIIFYHSDGDVRDVVPELIEIGVEALNPVQPECMDPAELKRLYGDRVSFWGTISTQITMPFGKPEDVRNEVRERIETVGKDGGLVLAPTHVLEPDVPWENILAFFEAVEEFGRY